MVTAGIFALLLTCTACSALYHPVLSLRILAGMNLLWESLWVCAALRLAVKLTVGSPSPRLLVSSTSHFRHSDVQDPKSLKSQYSFKISAERGSRSDMAARFPGSGCLPGDWVMCLRCS